MVKKKYILIRSTSKRKCATFDAPCTSVGEGARLSYACHRTRTDGRMDRRADKWKGERGCSRPERTKGWNGWWVRWAVERVRRNYLSSCVFIFRVITNEVNRNRTELILLSIEKSHRRLSVHPRSRSFRLWLTAMRCDASRPHVCHFYTTGIARVCSVFDAGKENRTDSPLGRRIKIIPLISDFRVLKTRARTAKRDKRKKLERNGEEYVKAVDGYVVL